MLNYEPQTRVITSEVAQVFVLLSDLSKICDVIRTLHSLKKGLSYATGFTNVFFIEMLTSLISFSTRNTFSLNLLFKRF